MIQANVRTPPWNKLRYKARSTWLYLTHRLPYRLGRALIKFAARDSNLVSHARREMPISHEEGPDKWMRDHMLELTALWSCHHHSGMSNNFAVQYAERLLRFKPIGPLTGEDSE